MSSGNSLSEETRAILKGLEIPVAYNEDGLVHWSRIGEDDIPDKDTNTRHSIPPAWRNIILCLLTILASAGMNVTVPLYAGSMVDAGSSMYCFLLVSSCWFPIMFFLAMLVNKYFFQKELPLFQKSMIKPSIVVGSLVILNGILIVFASPPTRTPPYLQAVLVMMMLPFTVIFRYIILRKGVGIRRLVCAGVVLIGVFISMEPQIWGLPGSGADSNTGGSGGVGKILWPLCFALGFVPAAISNVWAEKFLKQGEGHSLNFIFGCQVVGTICTFFVFWVDLIPGFGMSNSIGEFWEKLQIGLHCNFSTDPACHDALLRSWLFMICYCVGNLSMFMLIQFQEGAVYAVIVQAMVTPVASLFWTVFKDSPFRWEPEFTTTTGFTLASIVIIVPTIFVYNYFSSQEETPQIDIEIEERGQDRML